MSNDKATRYATGPTNPSQPLLTIDALAAILVVDRKTVYRLGIPYVVVGDRRRYRQEDVNAYLDARKVSAG